MSLYCHLAAKGGEEDAAADEDESLSTCSDESWAQTMALVREDRYAWDDSHDFAEDYDGRGILRRRQYSPRYNADEELQHCYGQHLNPLNRAPRFRRTTARDGGLWCAYCGEKFTGSRRLREHF